jgi:hypothetical protein
MKSMFNTLTSLRPDMTIVEKKLSVPQKVKGSRSTFSGKVNIVIRHDVPKTVTYEFIVSFKIPGSEHDDDYDDEIAVNSLHKLYDSFDKLASQKGSGDVYRNMMRYEIVSTDTPAAEKATLKLCKKYLDWKQSAVLTYSASTDCVNVLNGWMKTNKPKK